MGKQTLTLSNVEIERNEFYRHKTPILLGDVDVEKVIGWI